MECNRIREILFEHADIDIPPELRDAVREHLAVCPSCTRRYELLKAQLNSLRTLPKMPVPDNFLLKVRAEVEKPAFFAGLWSRISEFTGRRSFLQIACTAAVALLIVATTQFGLRDSETRRALQFSPPAEAPSPIAPPSQGETVRRSDTLADSSERLPVPGSAATPPPALEATGDAPLPQDTVAKDKALEDQAPAPSAAQPAPPVRQHAQKRAPAGETLLKRDESQEKAVGLEGQRRAPASAPGRARQPAAPSPAPRAREAPSPTADASGREFKYGGKFRAGYSTSKPVELRLRFHPAPASMAERQKSEALSPAAPSAPGMESTPKVQAPRAAAPRRERAGGMSLQQEKSARAPFPAEGHREKADLGRLKELINRSEGRILSETPSPGDNAAGSFSIDLPARNYPAFIRDLRLLGQIESGEEARVDSSAGDAIIRINLKFIDSP